MLHTILACECITYDVSYVLVLSIKSLPSALALRVKYKVLRLITAVMTEDFYTNVTDVCSCLFMIAGYCVFDS